MNGLHKEVYCALFFLIAHGTVSSLTHAFPAAHLNVCQKNKSMERSGNVQTVTYYAILLEDEWCLFTFNYSPGLFTQEVEQKTGENDRLSYKRSLGNNLLYKSYLVAASSTHFKVTPTF